MFMQILEIGSQIIFGRYHQKGINSKGKVQNKKIEKKTNKC